MTSKTTPTTVLGEEGHSVTHTFPARHREVPGVARDADLHSRGRQALASTVDFSRPGQTQDSDQTHAAHQAVGLCSHNPHTADVMYLLTPSFPLGSPGLVFFCCELNNHRKDFCNLEKMRNQTRMESFISEEVLFVSTWSSVWNSGPCAS